MNARTLRSLRGCALLLAAAGGCGGTETGNPTLPAVELRLAALSNDFGSVAINKPGPGIVLERAVASLAQIRLVPCSASAPPVDFESIEVDLAQSPAVEVQTAGTASEYCSARVTLAPGVLEGLAGQTLRLSGTRPDGAPFELSSALELAVDLHTDPPNTPFDAHRMILGFNFATWLSGVDIAGATLEDGLVTIDATHNADVLVEFEARAPLTPALYDDADGNGLLSGDNQPPAAGP
jgi:hypothetical protein